MCPPPTQPPSKKKHLRSFYAGHSVGLLAAGGGCLIWGGGLHLAHVLRQLAASRSSTFSWQVMALYMACGSEHR